MENYADQDAIKETFPLGSISPAIEKEVDNGHKEETKDESVSGDEEKTQEVSVVVEASGKRAHALKVGILDVSLFGADVMSDGVQVGTHYRNCTT